MILTMFKTILIYFVLVLTFRILGKREVGELSIFDLVILLIIADVASIGLDEDKMFLSSIVAVIVLIILQKLIAILLLKIPKLRDLIDGKPKIIVIDGKINFKAMKKEFYNMDDLIFQMHQSYIMDIKEIKLAILETNGTLSIFRKTRFDYIALPIIISGSIKNDNIKALNIDSLKIKELFDRENINIKNVMYASFSENLISYFYLKSKDMKILEENILYLQ